MNLKGIKIGSLLMFALGCILSSLETHGLISSNHNYNIHKQIEKKYNSPFIERQSIANFHKDTLSDITKCFHIIQNFAYNCVTFTKKANAKITLKEIDSPIRINLLDNGKGISSKEFQHITKIRRSRLRAGYYNKIHQHIKRLPHNIKRIKSRIYSLSTFTHQLQTIKRVKQTGCF
ncbi:sensor histidine kinase [Labilibacter sediminis]|nr:sensor histidine kinase [Labilibacter sediminis]